MIVPRLLFSGVAGIETGGRQQVAQRDWFKAWALMDRACDSSALLRPGLSSASQGGALERPLWSALMNEAKGLSSYACEEKERDCVRFIL